MLSFLACLLFVTFQPDTMAFVIRWIVFVIILGKLVEWRVLCHVCLATSVHAQVLLNMMSSETLSALLDGLGERDIVSLLSGRLWLEFRLQPIVCVQLSTSRRGNATHRAKWETSWDARLMADFSG
jgi:hypothetical protein